MKQIDNRNKMTSYSENNITISIDQDPINQLVLTTSNRLQSSNPMFQFTSLHNLIYLLQAELQGPMKPLFTVKSFPHRNSYSASAITLTTN